MSACGPGGGGGGGGDVGLWPGGEGVMSACGPGGGAVGFWPGGGGVLSACGRGGGGGVLSACGPGGGGGGCCRLVAQGGGGCCRLLARGGAVGLWPVAFRFAVGKNTSSFWHKAVARSRSLFFCWELPTHVKLAQHSVAAH